MHTDGWETVSQCFFLWEEVTYHIFDNDEVQMAISYLTFKNIYCLEYLTHTVSSDSHSNLVKLEKYGITVIIFSTVQRRKKRSTRLDDLSAVLKISTYRVRKWTKIFWLQT